MRAAGEEFNRKKCCKVLKEMRAEGGGNTHEGYFVLEYLRAMPWQTVPIKLHWPTKGLDLLVTYSVICILYVHMLCIYT